MTPTSIEFVGAEGNRLAADLWDGGGQPVLFLHGGGQTRHAWNQTARRVAKAGMRAITVDLRGHGESEWVKSGNYSFAAYGADTASLIRQIAARFDRKPSAVGASLGGLSSLIAELDDGPLLDLLVLVDVTPRMDINGVAKILGFMSAQLEEGFASLEEAADAISAYMPNRRRSRQLDGLRKNLRLDADGRFRWHWDPAFVRSDRNINFAGAEMMEGLLARLPELQLPVLLVRGMESELIGEAAAHEFVDSVPQASYVDVVGAGHMVAGDRNDVFSQAVLDFLGARQAA